MITLPYLWASLPLLLRNLFYIRLFSFPIVFSPSSPSSFLFWPPCSSKDCRFSTFMARLPPPTFQELRHSNSRIHLHGALHLLFLLATSLSSTFQFNYLITLDLPLSKATWNHNPRTNSNLEFWAFRLHTSTQSQTNINCMHPRDYIKCPIIKAAKNNPLPRYIDLLTSKTTHNTCTLDLIWQWQPEAFPIALHIHIR